MLSAFTVERICIQWKEAEMEIAPAVLAAAEDTLFQNRAYQMILHGSVSEKMELVKGKEERICT